MKKLILLLCLLPVLVGFEVGDYVETTAGYLENLDSYLMGKIVEIDYHHPYDVCTVMVGKTKHSLSGFWLQRVENKLQNIIVSNLEIKYKPQIDTDVKYGVARELSWADVNHFEYGLKLYDTKEELNKAIKDKNIEHIKVYQLKEISIERVTVPVDTEILRVK